MPKHHKKKQKKTKGEVTEIVRKEDEQEYAKVVKVLGGGKFRVKLNGSKKEIIASLRGKMKKQKRRYWVELGSVVLITYREFEDKTVDIVHVFKPQDVSRLKREGEFEEDDDDSKEEDDIGIDIEHEDNIVFDEI